MISSKYTFNQVIFSNFTDYAMFYCILGKWIFRYKSQDFVSNIQTNMYLNRICTNIKYIVLILFPFDKVYHYIYFKTKCNDIKLKKYVTLIAYLILRNIIYSYIYTTFPNYLFI